MSQTLQTNRDKTNTIIHNKGGIEMKTNKVHPISAAEETRKEEVV